MPAGGRYGLIRTRRLASAPTIRTSISQSQPKFKDGTAYRQLRSSRADIITILENSESWGSFSHSSFGIFPPDSSLFVPSFVRPFVLYDRWCANCGTDPDYAFGIPLCGLQPFFGPYVLIVHPVLEYAGAQDIFSFPEIGAAALLLKHHGQLEPGNPPVRDPCHTAWIFAVPDAGTAVSMLFL